MKKKKRKNPVPSIEDMALIAFSKEKNIPLISNDADLTFFSDELYNNNLSDKIFNFNELDIYNN